jgi:tetratricopeptide (TPR) repeat protein
LLIDPNHQAFNSVLYYNRGASRYQLGDYQGAFEDCSEAIELNDDVCTALFRGEHTNQITDAHWPSVVALEKYAKAYAKRAAASLKLEKYEEAVRDYQRAHDLDPENRCMSLTLRSLSYGWLDGWLVACLLD